MSQEDETLLGSLKILSWASVSAVSENADLLLLEGMFKTRLCGGACKGTVVRGAWDTPPAFMSMPLCQGGT